MIFIQPSIDPILISFGFLDIRWYSLSYIFTFIFGSLLIKKLNKKSLNNLSDIQILCHPENPARPCTICAHHGIKFRRHHAESDDEQFQESGRFVSNSGPDSGWQ